MAETNRSKTKYQIVVMVLLIGVVLLFIGCKDSGSTDTASEMESCQIYMDEGKWSDAIEACETAGGDEGYHNAALAYMASSGLTIVDLAQTLLDSSGSSSTASAIFSYVPESDTDRSNYNTALSYLMGSKISTKTQTIYFEALLVSSMIVFGELKAMFGLDQSGDTFTTCSLDATQDADRCGFDFDITSDGLHYSGFGSTFYSNLCGGDSAVDSTYDSTVYTTGSAVDITYDATIDSCTIASTSVLQYNKNAFDNYVVTDAFKDGDGNSVLSSLDFYTLFDTGERFNTSGDEIPICKTNILPSVATGDSILYDCEILYSVFDPSSDLL